MRRYLKNLLSFTSVKKKSSMKITKEQLKALNPCTSGFEWYLKNCGEDLLENLLKINAHRPDWSRWLFARLMTVKQRRMIAVFAAEQVLSIFEKEYPEDLRPRKAIEAAKKVIETDSDENRKAADAAAAAAYAADAAADAAAAYARKEMQEKIIREAVRILEGV